MKSEVKIIDAQINVLLIFLVTVIVSILLLCDQKLKLNGSGKLFINNTYKYILLINKLIVLCIAFFFVYINYIQLENSKRKGQIDASYNHQLIAAILTFVAAIIVIYTVIETWNQDSFVSVENPEI